MALLPLIEGRKIAAAVYSGRYQYKYSQENIEVKNEDPKEIDEGDRALDADGHLNDSRVCNGYLVH